VVQVSTDGKPGQLTRDGHFGHLEDGMTGARGDPAAEIGTGRAILHA